MGGIPGAEEPRRGGDDGGAAGDVALELDVDGQPAGAREGEDLGELGTRAPAARGDAGELGPGEIDDGAGVGARGDVIEVGVVEHDELAGGADADVELDALGAFAEGLLEGGQRVLRRHGGGGPEALGGPPARRGGR